MFIQWLYFHTNTQNSCRIDLYEERAVSNLSYDKYKVISFSVICWMKREKCCVISANSFSFVIHHKFEQLCNFECLQMPKVEYFWVINFDFWRMEYFVVFWDTLNMWIKNLLYQLSIPKSFQISALFVCYPKIFF